MALPVGVTSVIVSGLAYGLVPVAVTDITVEPVLFKFPRQAVEP